MGTKVLGSRFRYFCSSEFSLLKKAADFDVKCLNPLKTPLEKVCLNFTVIIIYSLMAINNIVFLL